MDPADVVANFIHRPAGDKDAGFCMSQFTCESGSIQSRLGTHKTRGGGFRRRFWLAACRWWSRRRRRVAGFPRRLAAFVTGQGTDHDVQIAVAEHFGGGIRLAIRGGFLDEAVDDIEPKFFVGFLPAFEPQLDADLHIGAKKLDGVLKFGGKIMLANHRAELNLLHLSAGVPRLFVALGLLIQELAVVYNAADWRGGVGNNLDEVQLLALGQSQCLSQGHDAQLLFVLIQDPDFAGADLAITPVSGFAGLKRSRVKRASQCALFGLSCFIELSRP